MIPKYIRNYICDSLTDFGHESKSMESQEYLCKMEKEYLLEVCHITVANMKDYMYPFCRFDHDYKVANAIIQAVINAPYGGITEVDGVVRFHQFRGTETLTLRKIEV